MANGLYFHAQTSAAGGIVIRDEILKFAQVDLFAHVAAREGAENHHSATYGAIGIDIISICNCTNGPVACIRPVVIVDPVSILHGLHGSAAEKKQAEKNQ